MQVCCADRVKHVYGMSLGLTLIVAITMRVKVSRNTATCQTDMQGL